MRNVAANTGQFMSVPVVRIYTVEDYFEGLRPAMPVLARNTGVGSQKSQETCPDAAGNAVRSLDKTISLRPKSCRDRCRRTAVWNRRQAMEIIADMVAAGLGLSISEIGQTLDWRGLNPLRVPEEADHHSHWIRAMDLHTEEKLRRNERGSIILTSNKGLGEWGELLGDTVIAPPVFDRLLHHSHVPNIRGESYRLREKRQAGLFCSHHRLGAAQENAHDNYPD